MDPEPASAPNHSPEIDENSSSSHSGEHLSEEEDPYSIGGPSVAFLGLLIAFATITVPFLAVLTDRPFGRESLVPTALETDGSKSTLPLSFKRVGQSRR